MENILTVEDKNISKNEVIIRLSTSMWHSRDGIYIKRSIRFLKRKCIGYNFLLEDCLQIGAEDIIPRIINLNNSQDGIYRVIMCNISRDIESGYIDDWDYKLIKLEC